MERAIREAIELIEGAGYRVLYTGSRVSIEDGIVIPNPYEVCLWEKYGRFYTLDGFLEDPVKAWRHYMDLIEKILGVRENTLYKSVVELYRAGFVDSIITTSIDGLYKLSGLEDVIEVNGCLIKACCIENKHCIYIDREARFDTVYCRLDGSVMRPCIRFYGEEIDYRVWTRALIESETADVAIVAGFDYWDSPSNLLPPLVKRSGGRLVVVDTQYNPLVAVADIWVKTGFRRFIECLLNKLLRK